MEPTGPASGGSRPIRYQPLVVVLLAVSLGIALDRTLPQSLLLLLSGSTGCLLLFFLLRRFHRDRLSALALFCSVAALAAGWHHFNWFLFSDNELARFAESESAPACVDVVVLTDPVRIKAPVENPMRTLPVFDRTLLNVRLLAIRNQTEWIAASGDCRLVVEGHLLGVRAGDELRVFASLAKNSPAMNPGQFDFAQYGRAERRMCFLFASYPDCVQKTQSVSAWNVGAWLPRIRGCGNRILASWLKPSVAEVAMAVLLGDRRYMDRERTETFVRTGTIHLLVVSGLHLGLLAGILFLPVRLGLLPRRRSILAILALLWCYALVTGVHPPVVRAAVIVTIFCVAKLLGRQALSLNSLAAAALIVLLFNPADLFRTGPQLSFIAVATLIAVSGSLVPRRETDPLKRLIAESRPLAVRWFHSLIRGLLGVTLASFAVWLVVLPLVMARYHLFSPAALLLSPFLSIPLAVGLVSGLGTLICTLLFPPLSFAVSRVCEVSLQLMDRVTGLVAEMPGAYYWVTGPAEWWLAGFYGLLAGYLLIPSLRIPRRWLFALLAGWISLGICSAAISRDDDSLRCTFVALDHGCGVILELPDGKTVLYDAGRMGSPRRGSESIAANLWSQGITHLDAVVLSHADADHYNALPDLLEKFSVGVVYVSPVMFLENSPALAALKDSIERKDVPLKNIWQGDRLRTSGEVQISVLHPPRQGVLGERIDNANSLVLLVAYQGRRILLTGDLETRGMDDVIAELPLDCDVVLAPHHGSSRSNPPGFAAWSTPDYVIVSSGRSDSLHAIDAAYQAYGARVLHTAERGAVFVRIAKRKLQVESFRPK